MDSLKIEFDLLTHRFITQRWKTPTGSLVRDKIIQYAKANKDLNPVISPHILKHPANTAPYEYPFYPPDAIKNNSFWLLSDDDLRGIHFYGEDFSSTLSFARKNLSHTRFFDCMLEGVDFEMTDLSYALFERCDLSHSIFTYLTAIKTQIIYSKMEGACFLGSRLCKVDLSGTDLKDAYFEDNEMEALQVNYMTRFNRNLQAYWHKRCLPSKLLADVYRPIRIAYKRAELNTQSDLYLMRERAANRKYILWPKFVRGKKKRGEAFKAWAKDFLWATIAGYGIKPHRILLLGLGISVVYALAYWLAGGPIERSGQVADLLSSFYFSLATFATLGYGDVTYPEGWHFMRLLSTSEAVVGAVTMALFVVILARKIIR